jgi:hypothetical protein
MRSDVGLHRGRTDLAQVSKDDLLRLLSPFDRGRKHKDRGAGECYLQFDLKDCDAESLSIKGVVCRVLFFLVPAHTLGVEAKNCGQERLRFWPSADIL